MDELVFGWRRIRTHGVDFLARAGMFAVLMAPLGCATMIDSDLKAASPEARRAVVTERVNARWALLLKGDLDAAYLFLSPASRDVVTLAEFKARTRRSGFEKVEVDSVECEPEVCKVQLHLTYDHQRMKGIRTPLSEAWIIDKNQAWYVWQR